MSRFMRLNETAESVVPPKRQRSDEHKFDVRRARDGRLIELDNDY